MPAMGIDVEGIIRAADDSAAGWREFVDGIYADQAADPCRYEVQLTDRALNLNNLRKDTAAAEDRLRTMIRIAEDTAIATRGESAGIANVQSWPEFALNLGAVPTAPLVLLGVLSAGTLQAIGYSAVRDLLPPGRPSASTGGVYLAPGVYLAGGELRGPTLRAAWDQWVALVRLRAAPAAFRNARARLASLPAIRAGLEAQSAELTTLRIRAVDDCETARAFDRDTTRIGEGISVLKVLVLGWLASRWLR